MLELELGLSLDTELKKNPGLESDLVVEPEFKKLIIMINK
jgi:hypothetical protein